MTMQKEIEELKERLKKVEIAIDNMLNVQAGLTKILEVMNQDEPRISPTSPELRTR